MRRTPAQRIARFGDDAPFFFTGAALPPWLAHSRADASPVATYIGADGLLKTVATAGAPRIDFTPGRLPGLLVERASTNLLINSNDFNAAGWGFADAASTGGAAVSPEGVVNASKLTEAATNNFHFSAQGPGAGAAAGPYCASRWFKIGERRWMALQIFTDSGANRATALVDLQTGTIVATDQTGSPSGVASGVIALNNGWFCAWITAVHAAGTIGQAAAPSNSATPIWSVSFPSYLGVVNNGAYHYGAQLEAGAYPTSYIPTTGQVARAADALSMASRGGDVLIVQTRSLATGVRSRSAFSPASGIAGLPGADVVLEAAKVYPAGTPAGVLSTKLTVDGPW